MFSGSITVYHTEDLGQNYLKSTFDGVSIYGNTGQSTNNGGIEKNDEYIIRIMTADKLKLYPDDYIVIGTSPDERPDFGKCLKIQQIYDNRRGPKNLWHYKIRCK